MACFGTSVPHASCELPVYGDPADIGAVADADVGPALQRIFGSHGLRALFGRPDVVGARRLACGGLNHLFLVAHAGRLAKCTRPRSLCLSEAREAERLRRDVPSMAADAHLVFPLATFRCRGPQVGGMPQCEIIIFEHLEGCRSLGDILRMFERTHPMGALKCAAPCLQHRNGHVCEHVAPLRMLVVRQTLRLIKRFQALHGRRHGDFKAENVLLDRRGVPRLVDFLSPFCRSCDREEFIASTDSAHPIINEMRGAFGSLWHAESQRADALTPSLGCSVSQEEAFHNLQLMEALEQLCTVQQSQNIFGPVPSLLGQIGISTISLAPTPLRGGRVQPALPPFQEKTWPAAQEKNTKTEPHCAARQTTPSIFGPVPSILNNIGVATPSLSPTPMYGGHGQSLSFRETLALRSPGYAESPFGSLAAH